MFNSQQSRMRKSNVTLREGPPGALVPTLERDAGGVRISGSGTGPPCSKYRLRLMSITTFFFLAVVAPPVRPPAGPACRDNTIGLGRERKLRMLWVPVPSASPGSLVCHSRTQVTAKPLLA